MLQQKSFILDPIKAAKEQLTFDKKFRLLNCTSLNQFIKNDDYDFNISGHFYYENHKPLLDGKLIGQLKLICQRTLKLFDFDCSHSIKLGFVTDDRFFTNFPQTHDPYVYENNQIDLIQIIKEEILLLLPMIPKNPLSSNCQIDQNKSYFTTTGVQEIEAPFAVLKNLTVSKK